MTASQPLVGIERFNALMDLWRESVEVQRHFNDLCLRIRALGLTVITFTVGAAGLAVGKAQPLTFLGVDFSLTSLVLFAGAFVWILFAIQDRLGYHLLLKSTSVHVGDLEEALATFVPEAGLSNTITTGSTSPKLRLNSSRRLTIFYLGGLALLLVAGCVTRSIV